MKKDFSTKVLSYGALLIALNIVITRLLAINAGPVRISLNFIPIALGSMFFGPWLGALFALIADVLGQLLTGGMPWLGFCINTAIYGVSYGFFFYKKEVTWKKLVICVSLQAVLVDAFLGSVWFLHYLGMPFLATLWARGIDALLMIPVKVVVIKYIWKYIGDRVKI